MYTPMSVAQPIVYRIDPRAEIVFVNSAWDEFAQQNEGTEARSDSILNQSIWSFIQGATLRGLYHQVIECARRGSILKFSFRCDSPTLVRWYDMKVAPIEGNLVEFRSTIVRERERSPEPLLKKADPNAKLVLEACSICLKLNLAGEWITIEELLAKRPMLEGEDADRLHHGICNDCFEEMRTKIEQAHCGR